jgi:hypothetical protein
MNKGCRRSAASSPFPGAILHAAAVALAFAGVGICAPLPAAETGTGGTIRGPRPEEVTPETELAVARGLGWLVRTQGSDGSWSADSQTYPVAMTALAGLALLSSGSTATRGPYGSAIRRAEAFLLASSDPSSGLISAGWEQRPMHGHAFAMTFLAQVLGQEESLERREGIKDVLRRAVALVSRAQTTNGGWYYQPNASSDEGTLTVTMMQGLRACHDAGIHVPKEIIDRGVGYIEKSTLSDGRVRYRLNSSQVREGVTCAAIVALWSAGRYDDELLKRIVNYMDRAINPNWGTMRTHATYVQYYLGQAKFLLGGVRWTQFYRIESRLLTGAQESDGSWLTQEERAEHGVGAVYSTSVALIILQLPYNRLPIFQR